MVLTSVYTVWKFNTKVRLRYMSLEEESSCSVEMRLREHSSQEEE